MANSNQFFEQTEIRDTSAASLGKLNRMLRNLYYLVFGNIRLGNLSPELQQEIADKASKTEFDSLVQQSISDLGDNHDPIRLDTQNIDVTMRNPNAQEILVSMSAQPQRQGIGISCLQVEEVNSPHVMTRSQDQVNWVIDTQGNGDFLNFSSALANLPKHLDQDVYLVANQDQEIWDSPIIEGFIGSGVLYLILQNSTLYGKIDIIGCSALVIVLGQNPQSKGKIITAAYEAYSVHIRACRCVTLANLIIDGQNRINQLINCNGSSPGILFYQCELYGAYEVLLVSSLSTLTMRNCAGSNGSNRLAYLEGGTLTLCGTKPAGDIENQFNAQIYSEDTTVASGTTPDQVPAWYTIQYMASVLASYRDGSWRTDNDAANTAYQGCFKDGADDVNTGLLVFDALRQDASEIPSQNIVGGRIYLKAKSRCGYPSPRKITLYLCDRSQNSGTPTRMGDGVVIGQLASGQGRWFALPLDFARSLANGQGVESLCIFDPSEDNFRGIVEGVVEMTIME